MKIAFDVDDTLIIPSVASPTGRDVPNYEVIQMFRDFQERGHDMIIWSGGGIDYASQWAARLGLLAEIRPKIKSDDVDVCYDDCDVDLAKQNIKISRRKNSISRKDWNSHKYDFVSVDMVFDAVDDLILDVWQQFAYSSNNEKVLHSGGLSTLERVESYLRQRKLINANGLAYKIRRTL